MKRADSHHSHEVETVGCPVCGAEVSCKVSYAISGGRRSLVGFECEREGRCGIPSWDPCPLYVQYVEAQV